MALKTHNTHINVKGYIYSGTSSVNGSAVLQTDSTTQGALLPRMTTGQRDVISAPATSLLLYNVTTGRYNYYSGSGWVSISIPVGPNGQVQYYKNGEFQSSADLYFDETISALGVGTGGSNWATLHIKAKDDVSANSLFMNLSGATLVGIVNDGSIYGVSIEAGNSANYVTRLGFGTPQSIDGSLCTVIGRDSLFSIFSAAHSTTLGHEAGKNLYSTSRDVLIGHQVYGNVTTNRTSADNIYIGYRAAFDAQNSSGNIAVGKEAGYHLQSNSFNPNLLIGYRAGYNMTTAGNNVAIADKALMTMATGAGNIAIGIQALWNLDGGIGNVATGLNSLNSLTTGSYNTGVGGQSLGLLVSGTENTAIGNGAGGLLTSGDYNVYIGGQAGPAATTSQSNRLYIHNAQSDSPLVYGEFNNRLFKVYGRIDSKSNGNTSATSAVYVANSSLTKLFEIKDDGSTALKNYSLPLADGTSGQVLATDGSGAISFQNPALKYGMAHTTSNQTQVINTSARWHLVGGLTFTGAHQNGFTSKASASGTITAYASGGVGITTVTSAGHTLSNGDYISITGSTNYNTVHLVSNVGANTFDINIAYVANDAVGTWNRGSTFVTSSGSAGKYELITSLTCSLSSASNVEISILPHVNAAQQSHLRRGMYTTDTNKKDITSAGYFDLAVGDQVYLAIANMNDATDIIINYGTFTLKRIG